MAGLHAGGELLEIGLELLVAEKVEAGFEFVFQVGDRPGVLGTDGALYLLGGLEEFALEDAGEVGQLGGIVLEGFTKQGE